MAEIAELAGVRKATMDFLRLFALAFLGGAFIALGAVFSITVGAGGGELAYGINRLIMGTAFSLGLILILVGGAELFTGNMLIVMAWANRKVSSRLLLRNWVIVYAGNFCGAAATAWIVFLAGYYQFGSSQTGALAMTIAQSKFSFSFLEAMALGALCNVLVCLAIWLTFSARTTTDRILSIVPPVTAFVACGFEHSVANMFFVPLALFIKAGAPAEFWNQIALSSSHFDELSWGTFLTANLGPVTLGNMIGGALMVAPVYWAIYLHKR